MLLVVIIVILLSVSLPVFFVNFKDNVKTGASWEDFTTYSRVNDGAFTLTSNKILGTTVYLNDACKIYWDFGSDAITNFWCDFTFNRSAKGSNSDMGGFAVSSTLSTWQEALTNHYNTILVTYDVNSAGTLYRIMMTDSSNSNNDQTANLDVPFTKYLRFNRTGSSANLYIYNDAAHTDLFDTLTITCNTAAWRYVYGHLSYGYSGAYSAQTGYQENLILNFPGQTYSNPWFNSSWTYCKKIVIDHKKVSGVLNNFPVLIQTSGAEYAFAQPDGDDFVFYAADNTTKYNHEIESFDGTNLAAWVNVTSLNSTVDTIIWMYYGNPTCSNQQNIQGTWDSNYSAVFHMSDSTGGAIDSIYKHNATAGTAPTYRSAGKIGYAELFASASSQYLSCANPGTMAGMNNITVETWVKMTTTATGTIITNSYTANDIDAPWRFLYLSPTSFLWRLDHGIPSNQESDAIATGLTSGSWYHIVGTWNNGENNKIYKNGAYFTQSSSTFTNMSIRTDTDCFIGRENSGTHGSYLYYLDGAVDEIRVSNISRSAAWITTEYNNQNSTSTFESFGPQQRYNPTTWYDSGWKNCKKIVIDHTKVSGDQTNFPVLISNISTDFSIAQISGNDFIFLNQTNQTKYNHEIESFDRSTGTLVAWVNIPYLSSSVDTTIYLYYGNPTCGNQQNVAGTWPSDYKAVWHMKDVTTSTIADSTINNFTGTKQSTNVPIETTGRIGKAQDFNGATNTNISTSDVYNIGTNTFTMSVWLKTKSTVDSGFILCNTGASIRFVFSIHTNNTVRLYTRDAGTTPDNLYSPSAVVGDTWYHLVVIRNGSTSKMYVNGSNVVNGAANSGSLDQPGNWRIGSGIGDASQELNATLDEIRVSSAVKSDTWITTEYNNQNSTSTFESFGQQQGSPYGISWYDPSWLYCKKITIDHTKVAENLTNFPILFSNISADFKRAQSTGNDFVFVDAINTTKYNHEIETFNSTTGELVAWINVTYLSCINDTIIYLYYGNPTCGNQQNAIGTWSSDYMTVQHLKDATTSTIADSTSNANTGTKKGANEPIVYTSGKIGYAQDFDGTNDYVAFTSNLIGTGNKTISMWSYRDTDSDQTMLSNTYGGSSDNKGVEAGYWTYSSFLLDVVIGNTVTSGHYLDKRYVALTSGTWHYMVFTVNTVGTLLSVYVDNNAAQTTSTTTGTEAPGDYNMRLGDANVNHYYFNGRQDEFRVSNVVKSANWITTEYNNQNSTSTFMTLGNEQTNWYNITWLYRQKITIDHNKVDADQTNFPVLVKTTMNTSRVQSTGNDIFFTSSSGVKLNHEIESYNSTTGALIAWVNVTSLSSTLPDTYIYIYYGNTTCPNQQNVTSVWHTDYKGVWHMKDTGNIVVDSTINKNNGTGSGTPTMNQSGKIYRSVSFDGINDYFSLATLNGATGTISAWIKTSVGTAYMCVLTEGQSASNAAYEMYTIDTVSNNGYIGTYCRAAGSGGANTVYGSNKIVTDGIWHKLDWVSSGSAWTLYVDGVSQSISIIGGSNNGEWFNSMAGDTWAIGVLDRLADYAYFNGTIEEVRYAEARQQTSSWIKTEYNNQNDTGNFTIYSTEEQYGGAGGGSNSPPNTPTSLGPTTRQISPSVTIYATATDPNGDAITMYFYNNATQTEIGHASGASGSNISISWSSLSQGTSYSFYAAAFDSQAWSANSSVCTFTTNTPPTITGLMTENLTDPNRITSTIPYFNWTYTDNDSDTQQKYQIQVGTTQNGSNLWDSGNVTSSATNVKYNGTSLSRSTVYYVRIRAYDGYEWSTW